MNIKKKDNSKTKKTFQLNLVLVIVLASKGLYCCILTSFSTIVSQQ